MEGLYELLKESPSLMEGDSFINAVFEYYAGRSKELIKCEEYCNNIINKMQDYDFDFDKIPMSRSDPDHRGLEQELAKAFNVREVSIYWRGGAINANTFTASAFGRINNKKGLMSGSGSNAKLYITVYTPIVTACDLTGAELLAVILHEVGHNFYWCPISVFTDLVIGIVSLGIGPLARLFYKGIYIAKNEISDWVRENIPMLQNICDAYNRFIIEMNLLQKPLYAINVVASIASNPGVIANYVLNYINMSAYGAERGADSFAARCGYGPEQASALKKLSTVPNTTYGNMVENGGAFGHVLYDLTELSVDLVTMLIMDPHPNTNQRASSMLKKLKRDLAKGDYPPGYKKDLETEIARMEKAYNTINDLEYNDDGPDIKKSVYGVIDNMTNGHSDIREIFDFYFKAFEF